jgi:hypothetical protein
LWRFFRGLIILSIPFFCLCNGAYSQAGAGGGATGGGGGGGGQNLYGFRYIIIPDGPIEPSRNHLFKDSLNTPSSLSNSFRYEVVEKFLLGILRGILHIQGYNSLQRDSSYKKGISPNDTLVKHFTVHKIQYRTIAKHHLEVAVLSRTQDTCMLEVWPPAWRLQNDNFYRSLRTVIGGIENGSLYSHDAISADTFYLVTKWTNSPLTRRHQSFNMLFKSVYLVPATVPIVYTTGTQQWQANFLSAGMAGGWAYGRTKFYRDNIMPPRNFYFGIGGVAGVNTVTLNAQSVSDTSILNKINKSSGVTYPGVYLGGHIAFSFNSIQLMFVLGREWAFGKYHAAWENQGKLFLGLGIGLSIFNLVVPSAAPNPVGH